MFWVEEEDGPVQGALVVQEHTGPGGVLGELVQSWPLTLLLVVVVRATPLWQAELDAPLLRVVGSKRAKI